MKDRPFSNLEESIALLTKKSDFLDYFGEIREIVYNKIDNAENPSRTLAHLLMATCAVAAEICYLSDYPTDDVVDYIDIFTEAFSDAENGKKTIKVVDETD